jgi:hypothetical protein
MKRELEELKDKIELLELKINGLKDYIFASEKCVCEQIEALEVLEKHLIREGIV